MKNYRFSRRCFFIDNFFGMRHENENDTIVSASSSRFETWTFDIENSISKSDLRSSQVNVMTQVGQYAYLPKRPDEPSRLAPIANLYLHPVARYGEKRIVISCHLRWPSRDSDHQLHPHHHRWGEWLGSWKNWVVSVSLCETESIFTFPHRFIVDRSRNWPELGSPG